MRGAHITYVTVLAKIPRVSQAGSCIPVIPSVNPPVLGGGGRRSSSSRPAWATKLDLSQKVNKIK
jgi:hypothetical protein